MVAIGVQSSTIKVITMLIDIQYRCYLGRKIRTLEYCYNYTISDTDFVITCEGKNTAPGGKKYNLGIIAAADAVITEYSERKLNVDSALEALIGIYAKKLKTEKHRVIRMLLDIVGKKYLEKYRVLQ